MTSKQNVNAALMEAFADDEDAGAAPVSAPVVTDRAQRRRQPLNGRALRLQVFGTIPGYHLYIAKDEGARLQLMIDAGYDFVSPSELQGFGAQAHNTDPGDKVRFVLGANGSEPLYGYLMKIKEEFWLEDQAALERVNRDIDDQIRGGRVGVKQGAEAGDPASDERRYTKPEHNYNPESARIYRSRSN